MTKISLQDIFTKAWNHFIIGDGKPCIGALGCRYRRETPDGETRCAVGLALSSEQIDEMEASEQLKYSRISFGTLVEQRRQWFDESILRYSYNELNTIQRCLHDSFALNFNKGLLKEEYLLVAKRYNLVVPT